MEYKKEETSRRRLIYDFINEQLDIFDDKMDDIVEEWNNGDIKSEEELYVNLDATTQMFSEKILKYLVKDEE